MMNNSTLQVRYAQKMPHILLYHIIYMYIHICIIYHHIIISLLVFRSLKRSNPHLIEDVVLIRALRDSNLPKFLVDDALLFG